ncbi:maleylpyruvate isomerase N-terminal domain-containing protein [Solwaraspora sp. WMMB335]|uniref:maleylpyruvate isomerase N-terminal domain-containing protein n=1 Tax=Solwaraspora sp. WMMB335 TaxID=3404118 RepID=UPI003B963CB7
MWIGRPGRRWPARPGVEQFGMDTRQKYLAAATTFADLAERISDEPWDGAGLGIWTLRELVGHTVSGGLQEVLDALDRVTDTVAIPSPERYYALARTVDPAVYDAAVTASAHAARRTGQSLGTDPAGTIRHLVEAVEHRLGGIAPTTVVTTVAGGMPIDAWLPTRTFELATHSLDIAAATDVPAQIPDDVLAEALVLAARIAVVVGDGASVLRALTGRATLPDGFSVV